MAGELCGRACGWCGMCDGFDPFAWDVEQEPLGQEDVRPCAHCGVDGCDSTCDAYYIALSEWMEQLGAEELAARAAAAEVDALVNAIYFETPARVNAPKPSTVPVDINGREERQEEGLR